MCNKFCEDIKTSNKKLLPKLPIFYRLYKIKSLHKPNLRVCKLKFETIKLVRNIFKEKAEKNNI